MVDVALPSELKPFFWDVEWDKLCVTKHARFIIERLLEYGNLAAVRWVVHTYPQDQITLVVKTSRRLSPKTGAFWALYLGLKEEDVACMRAPLLPQPARR